MSSTIQISDSPTRTRAEAAALRRRTSAARRSTKTELSQATEGGLCRGITPCASTQRGAWWCCESIGKFILWDRGPPVIEVGVFRCPLAVYGRKHLINNVCHVDIPRSTAASVIIGIRPRERQLTRIYNQQVLIAPSSPHHWNQL
jgi:hypothetical protein